MFLKGVTSLQHSINVVFIRWCMQTHEPVIDNQTKTLDNSRRHLKVTITYAETDFTLRLHRRKSF